MNSTEKGRCDFCGESDTVAVSEQNGRKVSICWACADWARDEIESDVAEKREAKRAAKVSA